MMINMGTSDIGILSLLFFARTSIDGDTIHLFNINLWSVTCSIKFKTHKVALGITIMEAIVYQLAKPISIVFLLNLSVSSDWSPEFFRF